MSALIGNLGDCCAENLYKFRASNLRNFSQAETNDPISVNVNLMGALEALMAKDKVNVEGFNLTIQKIMEDMAMEDLEIQRHLFHRDGTPRVTARVILNGRSPISLDEKVKSGDDILFNVTQPCDG
jgi:hypothetical protein